MNNAERRRAPRFSFREQAVAVFSLPVLHRDLALLDISMTGARVEAANPQGIVLGAKCSIRLPSANESQPVEIDAVVVRRAGTNRFGLEAHHMSPSARNAVRRFEQLTSLASQAQREFGGVKLEK